MQYQVGKQYKIIALKPFIEQRSGRSYQTGDVIDDPLWHDPANELRRASAYEVRGIVKIEEAGEANSADEAAPKRAKKAKE